MLSGLRACSPEEVVAQARYLFDTPVWSLACDLRNGARVLWRAAISSHRDLGSLPTIFGDIGGHRPAPGSGRATFTVSEILPLLLCHHAADLTMLRAIEELMAADAAGRVEYNATILRSKDALMLVDGNKRTVAFYERWRATTAGDSIEYPVFVIDRPVPILTNRQPAARHRRRR